MDVKDTPRVGPARESAYLDQGFWWGTAKEKILLRADLEGWVV
ncbi:hypothetical protein OG226_20250 [Streptomyces sp. NBC_01261]|nr:MULTISPECIES: hypothetical protein [unclassified Streptomyces]